MDGDAWNWESGELENVRLLLLTLKKLCPLRMTGRKDGMVVQGELYRDRGEIEEDANRLEESLTEEAEGKESART